MNKGSLPKPTGVKQFQVESVSDKHSSLLCKFVNYNEYGFITSDPSVNVSSPFEVACHRDEIFVALLRPGVNVIKLFCP